jgi:hypothetical protein
MYHCVSVNSGIDGCDAFTSFGQLPTPCPKTLWEAKTREEWEAEYSAYTASQEPQMDTLGMLIDAHRPGDDPVRSRLLDFWNGRTDTLGTLLGIAASMVQDTTDMWLEELTPRQAVNG